MYYSRWSSLELPFQALTAANDRYFISEHPIYYAPSLGALHSMNKVSNRSDLSFIAFGNPVKEKKSHLRWSKLKEKYRRFPKLFDHRRKRFSWDHKQLLNLSHLNTELSISPLTGVVDNRDPMYSYLALTKTDGVENDCLPEAREIVNMKLTGGSGGPIGMRNRKWKDQSRQRSNRNVVVILPRRHSISIGELMESKR